MTGPRIVALGGGHGLAASLTALRHLSENLTGIVTVADDGGSSGRLRRELGILPPGDLRMALAALCDDTDWGRTWADVLQHRFTGDGELAGHAVGNLLIASLWQRMDDPVAGLEWVGRLLGARGRVLPMSTSPLTITAEVQLGSELVTVTGQHNVAVSAGRIRQVRLVPPDPPACDAAVDAVRTADWVILGPGSWFTSVIPHLLVPELAQALRTTRARICLVMNLGTPRVGEAAGLSPAEHIEAMRAHAPGFTVDAVLADPSAVEDLEDLHRAVEDWPAKLVLRQVRSQNGTAAHDSLLLAAALRDILAHIPARP